MARQEKSHRRQLEAPQGNGTSQDEDVEMEELEEDTEEESLDAEDMEKDELD